MSCQINFKTWFPHLMVWNHVEKIYSCNKITFLYDLSSFYERHDQSLQQTKYKITWYRKRKWNKQIPFSLKRLYFYCLRMINMATESLFNLRYNTRSFTDNNHTDNLHFFLQPIPFWIPGRGPGSGHSHLSLLPVDCPAVNTKSVDQNTSKNILSQIDITQRLYWSLNKYVKLFVSCFFFIPN